MTPSQFSCNHWCPNHGGYCSSWLLLVGYGHYLHSHGFSCFFISWSRRLTSCRQTMSSLVFLTSLLKPARSCFFVFNDSTLILSPVGCPVTVAVYSSSLMLLPGTRRRWRVHSSATVGNEEEVKVHAAVAVGNEGEKVESSHCCCWKSGGEGEKLRCCCCLERGGGGRKFTLLLLPGTRRWGKVHSGAVVRNKEEVVKVPLLLLPGTRKRRWKVHAALGDEEVEESLCCCCCWKRGGGGRKVTLLLLEMRGRR
jgi:hypothetical protein